MLVLFSNDIMKCNRQSNWIYDCIVWNDHVQQLCQLGKFHRTYRMSESAFEKLLGILYPKLHKDVTMSNNSTRGLGEVIIPEVTMAIGIRLLAGASYIDLTTAYGVSESSVFLSRNIFVDAVNTCDTLKIVFPDKRRRL